MCYTSFYVPAAEFVVIAKAIDRYVEERTKTTSAESGKIDSKLQGIIESILNRCIQDGEYKQARLSNNSMHVSFIIFC